MFNRCEAALLAAEVGVEADAADEAETGENLEAQIILANAMKRSNIDCDGLAWSVLRDLVRPLPPHTRAQTHTRARARAHTHTHSDHALLVRDRADSRALRFWRRALAARVRSGPDVVECQREYRAAALRGLRRHHLTGVDEARRRCDGGPRLEAGGSSPSITTRRARAPVWEQASVCCSASFTALSHYCFRTHAG